MRLTRYLTTLCLCLLWLRPGHAQIEYERRYSDWLSHLDLVLDYTSKDEKWQGEFRYKLGNLHGDDKGLVYDQGPGLEFHDWRLRTTYQINKHWYVGQEYRLSRSLLIRDIHYLSGDNWMHNPSILLRHVGFLKRLEIWEEGRIGAAFATGVEEERSSGLSGHLAAGAKLKLYQRDSSVLAPFISYSTGRNRPSGQILFPELRFVDYTILRIGLGYEPSWIPVEIRGYLERQTSYFVTIPTSDSSQAQLLPDKIYANEVYPSIALSLRLKLSELHQNFKQKNAPRSFIPEAD